MQGIITRIGALVSTVLLWFSTGQISHTTIEPLSLSGSTPSVIISPSTAVNPPLSFPPLSVDMVFGAEHDLHMYPPEKTIRLIATGDVIPARSVHTRMIKYGNFDWPFLRTKELLSQGDLTVINLETPLLDSCAPTDTGMTFCGASKIIPFIKSAGIDVATLANNHIRNHGVAGLEETIQHLEEAQILPVATGASYTTVKGVRFGFLAYNDIGAPDDGVAWDSIDLEQVRKDVGEAKKHADVVIVSYHWGIEYVREPNLRQKEVAHATIDAGADLVIGNHPHWVQPIEFYKGKLITYAHGNFIFDQMWSQETREGVVGTYTFVGNKLVDVNYTPIVIEDYGQPRVAEGPAGEKVLRQMHDASKNLIR